MIPFFELNLVLKGLSDATFSRWEPDWLILDQVIKTIREHSKLGYSQTAVCHLSGYFSVLRSELPLNTHWLSTVVRV